MDAQETIGEILDYGQSFKEEVLDPLFLSGDFLNPDVNNDGAVSLPFLDNDGDGDVEATGATLAELQIGSIQDLVDAFADYLDIPGLKANFSGGQLTFTIDFFRAFGLGDGSVATLTQGETGVTDEVQKLQLTDQAQSFRLAFRDSLGHLQITAPIAFDPSAVDLPPFMLDVDSKLEALSGIGATKVSVASLGAHAFRITFDNSLGNVPQLTIALDSRI